jgi:hypothetical protein
LSDDANAHEDPRDAMNSAWENYHKARERRHLMHDLVRTLWGGNRIDDGFGQHVRESMEPREKP